MSGAQMLKRATCAVGCAMILTGQPELCMGTIDRAKELLETIKNYR